MSKNHKPHKHNGNSGKSKGFDSLLDTGEVVGNSFDMGGSPKNMAPTQRCYHTHPPLKIPGTDLLIYGGSCITPAVKDAQIYLGFDRGQGMVNRPYGWRDTRQIHYEIVDMSVPADVEEFKELVKAIAGQLKKGFKIHCGCIGGHGRTGLFFAALVKTMSPETEDAITYVRENYCKKAVESQKQIDWLHEHFGIKKAAPSKPPMTSHSGPYSGKSGGNNPGFFTGGSGSGDMAIEHLKSAGSMWRKY